MQQDSFGNPKICLTSTSHNNQAEEYFRGSDAICNKLIRSLLVKRPQAREDN